MTTEAPIRQFRPMRHVGADDRVRTDGRALADPGRRVHVRGRIDEGGAGLDGQQQFGLGHDLTVHVTPRPAPWPAARGVRPSVTSRSQAIAGDDLPAELGVVDAAQRDARASPALRRDRG